MYKILRIRTILVLWLEGLLVIGGCSCTRQPTWQQQISNSLSLLRDKKFGESLISGEKAVEIAKEEYGTHSWQLAETYIELGELYYYHLQNGDKAYAYFDSALVMQEYIGNNRDPRFPRTLNYLALIRTERNDFSDTTEHYLQQARVRTEALLKQTDTSNVALYTVIMVNLASYYESIGNYDNATNAFRKVIQVREHYDDANPQNFGLYIRLVRSAIEVREPDYRFARDITFHIKNILESAKLAKGPVYAATLGILGEINRKQRNYDSAMYYQKQALYSYEEFDDNEGRAITYHNLASIANNQKKFAMADSLFNQALFFQRAAEPNNIVDRVQVMFNQGLNYLDWGKYSEARTVLSEVWEIYRQLYGESNVQTMAARRTLDSLYPQ